MLRVRLVLVALLFAALVACAYYAMPDTAALERGRTRAAEQPLVAAPYTAPDTLEDTAEALKHTARRLSNIQDMRTARKDVFSLYPADFFSALAQAERERERFVSEGGFLAALRYYRAADNALVAYVRDLNDFRDAFNSAVPASAGAYVVPQVIISRDTFLATLDAFETNARNARRRLAEEKRCTLWSTSVCPHANSEQPGEPDADAPSPLVREVHDLTIAAEVPLKGTLVGIPTSVCALSAGEPGFFAFTADEQRILSLHDLRFFETEREKHIPFYAYLAQEGIAYVPVRSNFYACPLVGFDYARASDAFRGHDTRGASGLILLAHEIVRIENHSVDLAEHDLPVELGAPFLFFVRSGALSFFGLGNHMFGGEPVHVFARNEVPKTELPYITYAELRTAGIRDKLIHDMAAYYRFMDGRFLTAR